MYYGERPPSPALALHVAAYWCFRVEPGIAPIFHTVPPDGCASLFVDARRGWAGLAGPHTAPQRIPVCGGERTWGARIAPGAFPSFTEVAAAALRNRIVPLSEAGLAPLASELGAALGPGLEEGEAARRWDAILGPWVAPRPEPDREVALAAYGLVQAHGGARIEGLAAAVGLSPRQLRRRFARASGLSPKEFARVRRVRASVAEAVLGEERSWTEIAATQGFSDQAHLVREIRRLLGLPPRDLRAYLSGIEHGAIFDR